MGIWGYILAVEELMADMEENALTQVAIVYATGSGGTQAGLNAGVLLHGASADVISYAVCDDESYFNAKAQEDWENLRAYRSELPDEPIKTLTSDKYIGRDTAERAMRSLTRWQNSHGLKVLPWTQYTHRHFTA